MEGRDQGSSMLISVDHILLTTDLSDAAATAYPVAHEQVRHRGKNKAQLTILHVAEDMAAATFDFGLGESITEIHEDIERQALQALEEVRDTHFSSILPNIVVLRGDAPVYEEILTYARRHHVSLIISSSHGRSGIDDAVSGSVTMKLIRNTRVPFLVVPARN